MKKSDGFSMRKNLGFILRRVAKHDKGLFLLCAMSAVGYVASSLLQVYLPKALVAGLEEGAALSTLMTWTLSLGIAVVAASTMRAYAQQSFWIRAIAVRTLVSEELYDYTMVMDFRHTEDPVMLDRIRMANQAVNGNIGGFEGMMRILFDQIPAVLMLFSLGGILTMLHPLIVAVIFLGAVVSLVLANKARDYENSRKDDEAAIERKWWYMLDNAQDFSCGKDTRLYHMQDWLVKRYTELMQAKQALLRAVNRAHLPRICADALFALLREGAVYGYLIWLYLQGEVALSDFAMYFAAVAAFSAQLNSTLSEVARSRTELRYVEYMRALLEEEDERGREDIPAPQLTAPDIKLERVSFGYTADKEILHDIDLHIQSGEKLAIVGLNGAGKTTLVKVLTRLYEPTKGRVTIGGYPAERIEKKGYYGLFSALFQEVRVFAVSVAENVAMKSAEVLDRDKVEKCLRLAGLWEKVASLPKGMDAMLLKNVDLNGTELSGGQNQRLALARALYKDAPIVVLDEPTAALDPLAEAELYERFAELVQGKTSIFISHRLSSTRFCDRILLMEDGRIEEMGTHEELMEKNGKYAHLFRVQAQYYQDNAQKEGA